MAAWYEFLAAFLKDWSIAILIGVLSAATGVLAWHTGKLVNVTRSSENIRIMPLLTPDSNSSRLENGFLRVRVSVRNVGFGQALHIGMTASLGDGTNVGTMTVSSGDMIELGKPYSWDLFGGFGAGDRIMIRVSYTDMKNNFCPPLVFTVQVPSTG